MDNRVVIAGVGGQSRGVEEGIREINGNGKSTMKIKIKILKRDAEFSLDNAHVPYYVF